MSTSAGSKTERRAFKRLRANLTVVFRVDKAAKTRMLIENRDIHATMIDLGEGGLSLLTNYDIPEGSLLSMKFTLFRVDKEDVSFYGPMDILGEIRYCYALSNNEYRLGISFKKISEQDRKEIAIFIGES